MPKKNLPQLEEIGTIKVMNEIFSFELNHSFFGSPFSRPVDPSYFTLFSKPNAKYQYLHFKRVGPRKVWNRHSQQVNAIKVIFTYDADYYYYYFRLQHAKQ